MTAHQQALADLANAQNHLTRALLIEPRDLAEIIELGENVRRAERRVGAIERGGR
jgi:hypothetical protein